jgi:hypothetical protein
VGLLGALACYVPALLIASRQDRALQRAGTDRVNPARKAVERSFGGGLIGLVYVMVAFVFAFGPLSIKSVGQGA